MYHCKIKTNLNNANFDNTQSQWRKKTKFFIFNMK